MTAYYAMGPTVSRLAERLVARLIHEDPLAECELKGIPYAAPPTHWNIWTGGLRQSLDTGAQLLTTAMTQAVAVAPARQLVVIGLSQGAASVHVALPHIAALGAAVLERVAAVLLYADPLRVAGDSSNRPPSAVDGALARVWDVRIPTPQVLSSRVLSFCGAEAEVDPVCEFRPVLRTLLGLYGNPVHTTYDDPQRPSGWIGPEFALGKILGWSTMPEFAPVFAVDESKMRDRPA